MHQQYPVAKRYRSVVRALRAAARLAPRRLLVIAALALAIGSVGPMPPARAAPAGDGSISIWMTATRVGVKHTICVDDAVTLRVEINTLVGVNEHGPVVGQLNGVYVDASAAGSVGSVSPPRNRTSPVGGNGTYFTFKAKKPGTVTLVFKAQIIERELWGIIFASQTVKAEVILTVEDCTYRITARSYWRVPGEANFTLYARITFAGLTSTKNHGLEGTAKVKWSVYTGQVGTCSGVLVPDSEATVSGITVGSVPVLGVTYMAAKVPLEIDCQGASGNLKVEVKPDTIYFEVPESGVVEPRDQVLHGPETTGRWWAVVFPTANGH
jgi:hypothetical protein